MRQMQGELDSRMYPRPSVCTLRGTPICSCLRKLSSKYNADELYNAPIYCDTIGQEFS